MYKSSSIAILKGLFMCTTKQAAEVINQNLGKRTNLSTTDEVPAPNVSVVRRFHALYIGYLYKFEGIFVYLIFNLVALTLTIII